MLLQALGEKNPFFLNILWLWDNILQLGTKWSQQNKEPMVAETKPFYAFYKYIKDK